MAAALLAPGVTTLRNMDRVRRPRRDDRRDARGRRRRHVDRRARDHHRHVGAAEPGDALRARHADARVGQRARTAARPLRRGARRDAGRRQHREPPARHAPPRARSDGCRPARRPRVHRGTGEPARRRADRARVPERRRDGEPADRGGARQGQTVIENAAREPEITELAAMLNRMGARGAGRRDVDDRGRGRGVARVGRHRDHGRPHRDRHAPHGLRHRRRRDHDRGRAASSTSSSSR